MVRVPQFEREITPQSSSPVYQNPRLSEDAFGVNIAKAGQNLGNAIQGIGEDVLKVKNMIDDTNYLEVSNKIEEWEQKKLYDKKEGYYYQTGKNAVEKSQDIMGDYDKYVSEIMNKSGFLPSNGHRVQSMIEKKRTRIENGVNAHDKQETYNWASQEAQTGIDNSIKQMVNSRNNPEDIKLHLQTGLQVCDWLGKTLNLDKDAIKAKKADYVSKAYESVLNTYISEGSLKAGEFFEQNKDYIKAEKHATYIGQIKNEEDKYTAKNLAESIIANSKDEEEALAKADAIKDINVSDNVSQRIRQKFSQERRLEDQAQADILNKFYDDAAAKFKNGDILTEDDIPKGLNGKNYIDVKRSLDSLNQTGDVLTDLDTKTYLWYTATNDADRFKNMNLSTYKMSLSKNDYQALATRQQNILKGDYFTVIGQGDATKNYIRSVTGINNKDEVLYKEYQGMVRAIEAKYGRSATDIEKESVLKYLGTNKDAYKLLERGVREQVGFYESMANKISYYASRHNGEMPPEKEVYQWLKEDTLKYYDKKYSDSERKVSESMSKVGSTWNGHTITSPYGYRKSPKKGASTDHKGIDLSYKYNESIYPFASGRVLKTGYDKGLGNFVDIKSSDGTVHRYGHANRISVKVGDVVNGDTEIAKAGSTGVSTGTHLHYSKIVNGKYVNPIVSNGNDVITMKNQLKNAGYSDEQIIAYFNQRGIK